MRTFNDSNDPPPGFFEMDMVAHWGKSVAGSHVHSLVLTDIASGWTEAVALVVHEQTLITGKVDQVRSRLPFAMLGLDVDNDSAFINETLVKFCKDRQIELDSIASPQKELPRQFSIIGCSSIVVSSLEVRGATDVVVRGRWRWR